MSQHTKAPVDAMDIVRQQGRAEYDRLLPTLLPAFNNWTIAIGIVKSGTFPHVLVWEPDDVKRTVKQTRGWAAYYVRAVGEDTLRTEYVIVEG